MVFVWVHVYMHVKAHRDQKRTWDSPHPVIRNPCKDLQGLQGPLTVKPFCCYFRSNFATFGTVM